MTRSNRVKRLIAGLTCVLLGMSAHAQDWQLVWSDEFDSGTQPDETKWSYQVGGGGWGNQELQYYTDARPENARIENGVLIIEARPESFAGAPYTSARLRTLGKGDWLYGRFEVRARLPEGLGTWPAIWMMPSESNYGDGGWPDNGEIDIMEGVGHEPDRTHSAVHMNALNHQLNNNPASTFMNATSRSDFHVYALEWTPTRITTYVDGNVNLVYERGLSNWTRWPFDKPFHLILNLAVGGTWGGAQGVEPNDFPTSFEVDYVRVYADAHGPPSVSVASAGEQTQYDVGESVSLTATATDPVSEIASLALYQGDGLLAMGSGPSIDLSLENVHPGCYELRADALDEDGWTAQSDTLHIQVGDTCGQAPYLMEAPDIPGQFEAEYYDLGGPGVAYLELTPLNTVGALRADEGVDIGVSADIGGGYNVENVTLREWTEYTVNVTESGTYRLIARLAATRDGSLTLAIDGQDWGEELAYSSTNSTTFFRNAVLDGVWLEEGIRTLRIGYRSFGVYINRYELQLGTSTSTETHPERVNLMRSVYPNPFTDRLLVELGSEAYHPATVRLVDVMGREVMNREFDSLGREGDTIRLDLPTRLSPGMYFLVVQTDTGTISRPVIRVGDGVPLR